MLKKRGLLRKYIFRYAIIVFTVLFGLSIVFAYKWSDNAEREMRQKRAQRLTDAADDIAARLDQYVSMTTRVLTNPHLTPYMLAGTSFNLYEAQKEFVKMMAYDDALLDMTLYYGDVSFPYIISTSSSFRRDQYGALCGLQTDGRDILSWLDGLDGVGIMPARMARVGRGERDVLLFSRVSHSFTHYNAILFCTLDSQLLLEAVMRAFDGLGCRVSLQTSGGETLFSLSAGDVPERPDRYEANVGAYALALSAESARESSGGYTRDLLVFLLPCMLVATALGMAMSIVLARRSYTPIQAIVTQLPDAGSHETQDELTRIREAFQWYAREQRSMESRFREQNHLMGDARLVQFLRGESDAQSLSLDFPAGTAARPALLSIDSLEEIRRRCSRREIVLLQSRVRTALKKDLPGILCAVEDAEDSMALLLPDAVNLSANLRRALKRAGEQAQVTLSIALGDALTDLSLLPERLDALRDLLAARYILGAGCFVDRAAQARISAEYTDETLPSGGEIAAAVREGKQEAWALLLNRFFGPDARLAVDASRQAYAVFVECLVGELRRTGASDARGDSMVEELLLPLETREDAKRRLMSAWNDAQRRLVFEQSVRGNRLRDDIVRYLDAHFAEADLCLQSLSDACGCSSAYASRYFKEKMGVTFSEYVDARRMCQAKRLLCDGDMLLKDIVRDIGYQDVNSFIRKFKRVNGVTPIAYREANRK